MTNHEQVEEQIRQVLATEARAIPLSNKLFGQDGLFGQLASTKDERRVVAQSALFKQAQKRLSELQQREAAEFKRLADQLLASKTDEDYQVKLEYTRKLRVDP